MRTHTLSHPKVGAEACRSKVPHLAMPSTEILSLWCSYNTRGEKCRDQTLPGPYRVVMESGEHWTGFHRLWVSALSQDLCKTRSQLLSSQGQVGGCSLGRARPHIPEFRAKQESSWYLFCLEQSSLSHDLCNIPHPM